MKRNEKKKNKLATSNFFRFYEATLLLTQIISSKLASVVVGTQNLSRLTKVVDPAKLEIDRIHAVLRAANERDIRPRCDRGLWRDCGAIATERGIGWLGVVGLQCGAAKGWLAVLLAKFVARQVALRSVARDTLRSQSAEREDDDDGRDCEGGGLKVCKLAPFEASKDAYNKKCVSSILFIFGYPPC